MAEKINTLVATFLGIVGAMLGIGGLGTLLFGSLEIFVKTANIQGLVFAGLIISVVGIIGSIIVNFNDRVGGLLMLLSGIILFIITALSFSSIHSIFTEYAPFSSFLPFISGIIGALLLVIGKVVVLKKE